jgi:hypothetical protein
LTRPLAASAAALVPSVALRLMGGVWAELGSAVAFVAAYLMAWMWMGPDPADREVWRRLLHRSK